MDFYTDAKKFALLSTRYRNLVKNEFHNDARVTMREIKELVKFNVDRLCMAFNVKLHKKTTKFDKGKGIPIIANSINNIISKGDNLKPRDLTTLNPNSFKTLDGINIMLDYSGSMWFPSKRDCIGNLMRIHAQNFLALVLVEYIKRITKNRLKIIINAFCKESVISQVGASGDVDYDLFVVHRYWGSGVDENKKLMPKRLQDVEHRFFLAEDLHSAIQESMSKFTKKRMKNFITLLITDGGLHRVGESGTDRNIYLKNFLAKLQSVCDKTTTMFAFIKEQRRDTAVMCKEAGIDTLTMNNESELNNCFQFFTHLLNKARG